MKLFDFEENSAVSEPTKTELRSFQRKQRNKRQRSVMRFIGENMASYGCILIVILMIGFIWTDMSWAIITEKTLIDGIVTITMFIVAQYLMTQNGVECGKECDVYVSHHEKYLSLRDNIYKLGTTLMYPFCDWRIDKEFEFYIRAKCKEYRIEYDDYETTYSKMGLRELKQKMHTDLAVKVYALNQTRHIELTPEILLTDGVSKPEQGGVGISASEYVQRHTLSAKHIALTVVTGIICLLPVFLLHDQATWELIIYTVFKLIMLLLRMWSGFNNGARAYNTIEVLHLQAKIKYLNLYMEFVDKKIYATLDGKYGSFDFMDSNKDLNNEETV